MELIHIKQEIERISSTINKFRVKIKDYCDNYLKAKRIYTEQYAKTTLILSNGGSITLDDGTVIDKLPVGLLKENIVSIYWKEKLAMDEAQELYKALLSNISALEKELSGYQSIFKHFE